MRTHIPPVLWFAVMLVAYGWLHVVIHIYLMHSLGLNLWWLLTLLAVLSIGGLVIARFWRNALTETLAVIGSVWMGVAFIMFVIFGLLEIISHTFRVPHYPLYGFIAVALITIISLLLARITRIKEIRLPLRGLRKRVKLVQLTDLHIGDIYREGFLERVVQQVNSLKPDVVVITGDLFDGAGKLHSGMVDALKLISCKHVLYVNGNHEVYEGLHVTNAMVDKTHVQRLDDSVATVEGIQFIGLSYPQDMSDAKRTVLKRLAGSCSRSKPVVLLRHEPKDLSYASTLGIDLQLSGHTHNGQLWPLNYLVRLAYERAVGLHTFGDYTVYISPGTGTWGPPMRLGSRSEITHFTLDPA